MNNFNSIVLSSLDIAQSMALEQRHTQLLPAHLFLGLIQNPSTFSSRSLKNHEKELELALSNEPKSPSSLPLDQIRPAPKLSSWLTQASAYATKEGRQEVTEKDLLRFLPQIFPQIDINYAGLEDNDEVAEAPPFLINLNQMAEDGKLDPVIGRSGEIRAVMEILGRRSKNNPVLVGPAGVGKTAIVEGLAEQIIKGQVPDVLQGKTIYSLEMGSLMAGTKFRGEFEERIQQLLKYIKSQAGQAILFIDEIHQLVGAGKTEGAMDAANLLKPALARGELHCIGATTPEEFQKYILNDSALERRFRSVPIDEPTKEDSIEILMGIKEKMEMHHGIKISDDAIYQAVFLSAQYITNKNLPDKAIDLVDEAASALKLSAEAMPAKLVALESDIRSKLILSKVQKDKELEKEIKVLEEDFKEKKELWEKEVLALKKVSEIKNRLERFKFDLEQAERQQDYEKASEIKFSIIPEVEKELEQYQHDWILNQSHVASVIARQTGVPVEKILQSQQDHILHLEENLNKRVFGQEQSISEISETLMASFAGLTDATRPLGSFLLLGPTGVGKTETAKALTQFLFDNEENIIRIDMSEYSEKHAVAKLIGAPAGYIGYEEGGILTEAVRRKPFAVILFDEIEKAHRDFGDILLQILDDGRLTDNKGRTIDFKNTIILMTSNAKDYEQQFKPEVLGRIDSILTFNALDTGIMKQLVNKQITLLNERLKGKNVALEFDSSAIEALMEKGHDPQYGARPLQSTFNKLVTRPLSRQLLAGNLKEGQYKVKWKEDRMQIE